MFMLCEAMKWNHLPLAGGLYDQDPELLDGFGIIFHERAEHDRKEHEEEERKRNRGMGMPRVKGASRPR